MLDRIRKALFSVSHQHLSLPGNVPHLSSAVPMENRTVTLDSGASPMTSTMSASGSATSTQLRSKAVLGGDADHSSIESSHLRDCLVSFTFSSIDLKLTSTKSKCIYSHVIGQDCSTPSRSCLCKEIDLVLNDGAGQECLGICRGSEEGEIIKHRFLCIHEELT